MRKQTSAYPAMLEAAKAKQEVRAKLCSIRGDNGESTWSKHYTFWECNNPKGHNGKHSWEREGRYLA